MAMPPQSPLKAILDTVGTIGLILGLIFVGYETRQNTGAIRGQTVHDIAEMSLSLSLMGIETTEVREANAIAVNSSPQALSDEQALLMDWWMTGALRVMENRFRQFELGTLDDLGATGGRANIYRSYFFRDWWERNGPGRWAGTRFGNWVEAELIPLTPTAPPVPPDSIATSDGGG